MAEQDIRAIGRVSAIVLAVGIAAAAVIRGELLAGPLIYYLLRLAIAPPRVNP
jgi:hypothetical protein